MSRIIQDLHSQKAESRAWRHLLMGLAMWPLAVTLGVLALICWHQRSYLPAIFFGSVGMGVLWSAFSKLLNLKGRSN